MLNGIHHEIIEGEPISKISQKRIGSIVEYKIIIDDYQAAKLIFSVKKFIYQFLRETICTSKM